MPYMVLGAHGQMVVDPFTQAAEQVFDGLGKRKKKGFFRKRFKKHLTVAKRLAKLTPHGRLLLAVAKKVQARRRKRQRGGVEEGDETEVVEPSGPIQEEAPGGYAIPEEPPPSAPPLEERGEYAPPLPIERRASPPPEAAVVPEQEPESPPPLERRTGGYTIGPGEEPWARTPGGPPAEEGEGPVEAAPGGPPAQSVEVEGCCGGYIVAGPTPKQRDYTHRRSMAASLRTPPYKGLGQADPFWYAPEWAYQRRVRASGWPPAEASLHTGSRVWGGALAQAHRVAGAVGGRPPVCPFERGLGLGQVADADKLREGAAEVIRAGQGVLAALAQVYNKYKGYSPNVIGRAAAALAGVAGLAVQVYRAGTAAQRAALDLAATAHIGQVWLNAAGKNFFEPLGERLYAADPAAYGAASRVFDDVVAMRNNLADLWAAARAVPERVMLEAVTAGWKSLADDVTAFAKFMRELLAALGAAAKTTAAWLPIILVVLGIVAVGGLGR